MKTAAIQHDITWEDKDANFARLRPQIAAVVGKGARLVALTEMFATGFTMSSTTLAENHDGPSTQFLREQAQTHDIWIGGSIIQRHPSVRLPYNQFVLAGPAGQVHRYAKMHPFTYHGEHEHYSAGTQSITVDVEGVRISPFICYDLRFADIFWERAAETDCFLVVASWPAPRRAHWRSLLTARAIENQAYVVGVNRVGSGGGSDHVGDSMIIDPAGETVADAGSKEQTILAEVDPTVVARIRAEFPFLADRHT
ncbi:MAG: carbon-nitrogen family hydrolase [Geodermatophilaceae bacterium]|nr:carbon-nitrogen family hydrolase [Geodermatophilaceae bacterium]